MKRAIWGLAVLTVSAVFVEQANAAFVFYSDPVSFAAQGPITLTSNFDDFNSGMATPEGTSFTRGSVTYTSNQNIVFGTASVFPSVRNIMASNTWTPVTGTIGDTFQMFGLDAGVYSSDDTNSLVNAQLTTNLGTYSVNGLNLSLSKEGLTFLGFVTTTAGEFFTGFQLITQKGNGWGVGLTNVQLGGPVFSPDPVPEPAGMMLAVLGMLSVGVGHAARKISRRATLPEKTHA